MTIKIEINGNACYGVDDVTGLFVVNCIESSFSAQDDPSKEMGEWAVPDGYHFYDSRIVDCDDPEDKWYEYHVRVLFGTLEQIASIVPGVTFTPAE